jgi:hypothetical protein
MRGTAPKRQNSHCVAIDQASLTSTRASIKDTLKLAR